MNLPPSPKLLRGSVQVLVFCSKEFLLIYMYSNYCLKYRIYISRTVTFLVNSFCIIVARHLFSFVLMMNSLRLEINWSGKKNPITLSQRNCSVIHVAHKNTQTRRKVTLSHRILGLILFLLLSLSLSESCALSSF